MRATHCEIQSLTGFEFSIKFERICRFLLKTIHLRRSRIAENTYVVVARAITFARDRIYCQRAQPYPSAKWLRAHSRPR